MKLICILVLCGIAIGAAPVAAQTIFHPNIPKTWDEAKLADWATPLAGINVRPTHISAKEYYSLPIDNLKTYPVYLPSREPAGYWAMLQRVGPKSLIETAKLKTQADWIEAGRRVFLESDHIHVRTLDPAFISLARDPKKLEELRVDVMPDGTLPGLVWVPGNEGVALGFPNCGGTCHNAYRGNGLSVAGAPSSGSIPFRTSGIVAQVQAARRIVHANAPFFMGEGALGDWLYEASGVPWRKNDIHERLKTMTAAEYESLRIAHGRSGGVPRWNGSIFYPAKIPDLIGIKDRKYIDHTATHLHRDIGDLMRYAALVSFAESAEFGSYRVLSPTTKRVTARRSDEALYALALYIYSLEPPRNPNRFDQRAQAGQKIFMREGCPACHTPPLYTSNKLTLASGFAPPGAIPPTLDVMRVSVGTDPSLALETRKGTGYYKIPSLKGLWYRGRYLHHGAVASLEEMFDPDRLKDTHVPGGWRPFGSETWAIRGHEFGLGLRPDEREQLIAFLRTL
jgi:hypothetical protein